MCLVVVKLRKRKIEGSKTTAKQTAELLRSVISQQRVPHTNQARGYIQAIQAIGEQLIAFSGISGVVYYTPQILEHAGICALVSNIGISAASACLLITAIITLLTLPCIAVSMRLMDVVGRRGLLLGTIPVLIVALVILVLGSFVNLGTIVNAIIPTVSVLVYFCYFFMAFGPIPNILCSEIFPTQALDTKLENTTVTPFCESL